MFSLFRTMRLHSILIFLFLSAAIASAQNTPPVPEHYKSDSDLQSVFKQANEYYTHGDMQKALDGYKYLVDLDVKNGLLFFNLGNTYFQLNQLGKTILWYERAYRYIPRSNDLHVNFEYARNQIVDEEFQQSNYSATVDLLRSIHHYLNLRETLWVTLLFFWILSILIFFMLIIKNPALRTWLRIPCWIVGIAFILLVLSSGIKIYQHEFVTHAIIMSSAVDIKTGPNQDLSTAFTLHEGTKVRVIQRQKNWGRIVLPGNSAFNGWLPEKTIEIIDYV